MIRTHELGHALGYNHVESRPSIMNPRAGGGFTDFDREALRADISARADFCGFSDKTRRFPVQFYALKEFWA